MVSMVPIRLKDLINKLYPEISYSIGRLKDKPAQENLHLKINNCEDSLIQFIRSRYFEK